MHPNLLFGEAIVVVLAAEVQLADRDHVVAALPQQVMPARHAPVVGHGVVPRADLVHIFSRSECGAGGDAHGGRRVRTLEESPAHRQPVEVGRRNNPVAIAAEHSAVVLIRHDD